MEIEILNEERLRAWCARIEMPAEGVDPLAQMARKVREDETLREIFQSYYQSLLREEFLAYNEQIVFHPAVEAAFSRQASLFYLLANLALLPNAEREYQRRGLSKALFDETMRDISFYYAQDSAVRGYWMYDEFPWIWRHLSCRLFRLGRLQYMLAPFRDGITALRSRVDGEILLLADPDLPLRADGAALGAGLGSVEAAPSGEVRRQPLFEENEHGWRGVPISPYGYALRDAVFLPRERWEIALTKGDWVIDIHIPRGDSLTTAECRDSFCQAADFFAWQYPESKTKAFYCHTWFFTPQLQAMLTPQSSIVRFQREFYLFPFPGSPAFMWNFVFGERYPDPESAPRDTTLRRATLDWLAQGKEIYDLPGVLFHDPKDFGTQPYMTRWDILHPSHQETK